MVAVSRTISTASSTLCMRHRRRALLDLAVGILALTLLVFALLGTGRSTAASLASIAAPALIQWQCIEMVITPCVCPGYPPRPCLRYSYWEPVLLVNTEAYTGLSKEASDSRFHEARVWPFPLKEVDPVGCIFPCKSPNRAVSLLQMIPYFISDVDPLWRTGDIALPYPVGTWGPLSPRTGWVAGSEALASALAFYRAVDVAFFPSGHVITRPSFVPATLLNNINLGYPRLTQCLKPGMPPALWEFAQPAIDGNYLWVYYEPRTCCIDPVGICTSFTEHTDPLIRMACAELTSHGGLRRLPGKRAVLG